MNQAQQLTTMETETAHKIGHLRCFRALSICIIRDGFFALIISRYSSYLWIRLLYSFLIRSYRYCTEAWMCSSGDRLHSNSMIWSSLNSDLRMTYSLPRVSEKMMKLASYICGCWGDILFASLSKFFMMTSGYSLNWMKNFCSSLFCWGNCKSRYLFPAY